MTLVLTLATPAYVIQVSDRLVTLKGSKRPHDSIANKTVVYRARNAIVAMGYSGVAYIDGTPTDEWLVRVLSGVLPEGGMRFGPNESDVPFDAALHRIKRRLDACAEVSRHGLQIAVGGWKQLGSRVFPFVDEITWRQGRRGNEYVHEELPYRSQRLMVCSIGADARSLIERHLAAFRAISRTLTVDNAEELLVRVLRDVSRREPTVGPHAMSVRLLNPNLGPSSSRFLPTADHFSTMQWADGIATYPVAHSPWVVAPTLLSAPSAEIGGKRLSLQGIVFDVEGAPSPDGKVVFVSSSIRRPPPPR